MNSEDIPNARAVLAPGGTAAAEIPVPAASPPGPASASPARPRPGEGLVPLSAGPPASAAGAPGAPGSRVTAPGGGCGAGPAPAGAVAPKGQPLAAAGQDPAPGADLNAPGAGTSPRTWVIEMEPGTPVISANHRMNRYALNRRIKDLHDRIGKFIRYRDKVPPLGRADITVEYFSPPRLKRLRHPLASDCITDEDNLYPTAKALVDGIVRAGVLKNDTKHYARSRCVLADETHPRGLLRIHITEQTGEPK
jgi:hypothetical protein